MKLYAENLLSLSDFFLEGEGVIPVFLIIVITSTIVFKRAAISLMFQYAGNRNDRPYSSLGG